MLRGEAFTRDAVARARAELLAEAGSAEGSEDFFDGNARVRAYAHTRARVCARSRHARSRMMYELRYRGQSYELAVESESADPTVLREAFGRAHEQRYGYRDDSAEVELVTVRASVWGPAPELSLRGADDAGAAHTRDGEPIQGPTVHPLPEATLYVPPGWSGTVDEWGTVRLERSS